MFCPAFWLHHFSNSKRGPSWPQRETRPREFFATSRMRLVTGWPHEAVAETAESNRAHLADETVAAAPRRRRTARDRRSRRRRQRPLRPRPSGAETRQAKYCSSARSPCLRSPPRLWRALFPGRTVSTSRTDDAYVRANNTTLGARVSGHIAAILAGDNAVVRAGDVVFKIDDGDYRIAVDAARTRIADPAGHHRPHRPSGRSRRKARPSRPRRSSPPRKRA